jgi:DNA-binding transcriptional MerR regulator/effector-binding domain-containing protein
MSKIFNLNVRTLRYYDDIGLLKPAKVDENSGYRYYSSDQFERVDTIKYLRALDISISQIRRFFENSDIEEMAEIMEEQEAEIRRKKDELTTIENKISNRLKQLRSTAGEPFGKIGRRTFPDRDTVIVRKDIETSDDIETGVNIFRDESMREAVVFQGKVGVSISKEDMEAGKFSRYSKVFIMLDPADPCGGTHSFIPGGEFLILRFNGSHDTARKYYRRMLKYAAENDLKVAAGSVEISIIDSGITNDQSKYVTEIQIPVK